MPTKKKPPVDDGLPPVAKVKDLTPNIDCGEGVVYVGLSYQGKVKAFAAVVVKVIGSKVNLIYTSDDPAQNDEHGKRVLRADNVSPQREDLATYYYKP